MVDYIEFHLNNDKRVEIWNSKGEYLGALEYTRVGGWMSWCLTDIKESCVYFSASCLDAIRKKVKELNAKKCQKG